MRIQYVTKIIHWAIISQAEAGQQFSCDLCDEMFPIPKNLARQQRIYIGDFPFICSDCGKRFPQKENCMRHKSKLYFPSDCDEKEKVLLQFCLNR
jgi:uncharacterized Zn-finger protein